MTGTSSIFSRILIATVCCGVVQAQDGRPDDGSAQLDVAFARIAESLRGVRSIQFEYTSTISGSSGLAAMMGMGDTHVQKFKYAEQRGSMRTELETTDVSSKAPMRDVNLVHEGRYQYYDAVNMDLSVGSRRIREDSAQAPLFVAPYAFSFKSETPRSAEALRDPLHWADAKKRCRWVGPTVYKGRPVVQIEVETPAYGSVLRETVTLDPALSYLPLRRDHKDAKGTLQAVTTIDRYREFQVEGGTFVMPLRTTTEQLDEKGEVASVHENVVDEGSLRVNQELPEELFVIPVSQAKIVRDDDTGKIIDNRDADEKAVAGVPASRLPWVVAGVTFAALLGALGWWRYRSRASAA